MATSQRSIATLSERIDKLVRQLNPPPTVVTLQIPHAMVRKEYDRVLEKHWELLPQDRNPQLLVVVQCRFGEENPDPGRYDGDEQPGDKTSAAWRAVAREIRAVNPLQFWEVPTDSLPQ